MNLNGLAYLTCTMLYKHFLIIMVIYIVNIICDQTVRKRLYMIERSILSL
jgi:hypothetical protein